jgi:hypothetical protein
MKFYLRFTLLTIIAILFICHFCSAETYQPRKSICNRKLRITREYEIPVTKGEKTVVNIPAMMSFWGATNEQVIESSEFSYNLEPNKIQITSDNRGMYRRNYELTWNSPDVDKINVVQTLIVKLRYSARLYTAVKLPYSNEIRDRFASSLGLDEDDGINPNNPDLEKICDQILKNSLYAEDAVEQVCDWINDNIKFKRLPEYTSDQTFSQKQGSCSPMSRLACAMLRRIGIPSEKVTGKFIGSDSAHSLIEVYFPDAGWVFYDLSNYERGFKTLDCIFTSGWAFSLWTSGTKHKWIDGYFSKEKDLIRFQENLQSESENRPLRNLPKTKKVIGARVIHKEASEPVKVRHLPISQIIMNLNIPPGKREYIPLGTDIAQQSVAEPNKNPGNP